MPGQAFDLMLRPVSLDDAPKVADLEATRSPDDPRDPEVLRFWWSVNLEGERYQRLLAERDGSAVAFTAAGHGPWETPKHFGWIRTMLRPDIWTQDRFDHLIARAESWLVEAGSRVAMAHAPADFHEEIQCLQRRGYGEGRRAKRWELDLFAGRDRLLSAAERTREQMRKQGVRLMTLADDDDPDRMMKLYRLATAAEQDVPTTMPFRTNQYEDWRRLWFENPGTREDRFWIAREGEEIVGLSQIGYPPVRGVPWTAFTATSRRARGRGIARALKYETVAQAIELGVERVRTNNDGENAPILHLNQEMGYRPIEPILEMHRELVQ